MIGALAAGAIWVYFILRTATRRRNPKQNQTERAANSSTNNRHNSYQQQDKQRYHRETQYNPIQQIGTSEIYDKLKCIPDLKNQNEQAVKVVVDLPAFKKNVDWGMESSTLSEQRPFGFGSFGLFNNDERKEFNMFIDQDKMLGTKVSGGYRNNIVNNYLEESYSSQVFSQQKSSSQNQESPNITPQQIQSNSLSSQPLSSSQTKPRKLPKKISKKRKAKGKVSPKTIKVIKKVIKKPIDEQQKFSYSQIIENLPPPIIQIGKKRYSKLPRAILDQLKVRDHYGNVFGDKYNPYESERAGGMEQI